MEDEAEKMMMMPRKNCCIILVMCFLGSGIAVAQNKIIVFQSDFGLRDGAVSAMKGVAMSVSEDLKLFDLTHEIPPYNIWEASVRLQQTVPYWPAGTVFVSVVDPGVGTERKPLVVQTKTGQYLVTPDNGTLTLLAESPGIESIRVIDLSTNRLKNSKESYTFEGRDVFAFVAARLAGGLITFRQVGSPLFGSPVKIPYRKASLDSKKLTGSVYILDTEFGNVWTNIGIDLFNRLKPRYGNLLHIIITHQGKLVYQGSIPYCRTFGDVETGQPLAYINSLMQLSFALNQGNFASTYGIGSGSEWNVEVTYVK